MSSGSLFYTTYRFFVEIQGLTEAVFDECTGLQAEIDVMTVQEGGRNDYVHQLPGRMKEFPRLVLRRGIAGSTLWDWFSGVVAGKIERKSITITLNGYHGMTPIRWDVTGALPVKWSGPDLNAASSEVAFESIELIHQGFVRSRR